VHHGSQEKYINKNYGATFIIWDRIFGTYQPEEEQVIYGISHPLEQKWNPLYINFHEYRDIWNDMRRAKGLRKKLFYLFGNPIDIAREKKAPVLATETQSYSKPHIQTVEPNPAVAAPATFSNAHAVKSSASK
jgi:hypothetical protein